MNQEVRKGSVVYIRYLDHVLFRNITKAIKHATERETVGWLAQESKDLICIQHDRTVESLNNSSGTASGLVLLRSCILEIRALPLQNFQHESLISQNDKPTIAECALQKRKRKTQPN